MFKYLIPQFLSVIIAVLAFSLDASDPFADDPRHQLVRGVQERFAEEIAARQAALGTANSAVALVDIAREYLERDVAAYSDDSSLQWSLVIHHVLSGYGYDKGVAETLKVNDAEQLVICNAFGFSSAYLAAQGQKPTISDMNIFGNPTEVLEIVASLNRVAASVLDDEELTREKVASPDLVRLRTLNTWSSHERFWAATGVLEPGVYGRLTASFTAYAGTPIGFLSDLTAKLDGAMRSMADVPEAKAIEDLVKLSQQILLTIAAGTPGVDEILVRLSPSTAAEWEVIRKALFLASSVTSNPERVTDTFLGTVFDCAQYYPQKTAPDEVKSYYWKVEALAKGFSSLWKGLKAGEADPALNAGLLKASDPLSWQSASYPESFVVERGSSYPVFKSDYEQAIGLISASSARGELAFAIALHPKLEHQQVFRTLYPGLTAWAEYHIPSQEIKDLVGAVRAKIVSPEEFQPTRLHLAYVAGKWSLKGLKQAADGALLEEVSFWAQGASTSAEFIGELTDARGIHLFSFKVDGPATVIKAISSGYIVNVTGEGANVTVANGSELGTIESSAYPLVDADTDFDGTSSAIFIKGASYTGHRGFLSARRSSIQIKAPSISTFYSSGFDVKHHNDKPYNFYSTKGHGMSAHKDVFLQGKDMNVSFSTLVAGQYLCLFHDGDTISEAKTHGSVLRAGDGIHVSVSRWWGDTETVFAGSDGSSRVQNRSDLIENSARAHLEFGRALVYDAYEILFLDEGERTLLARGPDTFGRYGAFSPRMPR